MKQIFYMNSTIKIFLLFLLNGAVLFGQIQEPGELEKIENKRSGMYIEVAGNAPLYYGNNFIAKAYRTTPGYEFGLTSEFATNFVLHIDVAIGNASVEKPELVGTIKETTITRVSMGAGFSFEIIDRLTFVPSLHIGYVKYGHQLQNRLSDGNGKTRDDGAFIGPEVQLIYTLINWLELSLRAQNNFDFLATQTAPEDESFFSNATSFIPSIGIRLKIL